MADEFSISLRLTVTKGYFSESISESFTDDMNIAGLGGGIQVIGLTPENLVFGDVAYTGWLYLENLDSTNNIDYGPDNSGSMVAFGQLAPGTGALLKLKPATPVKAMAWTAPCRLLVKCFDSSTGT